MGVHGCAWVCICECVCVKNLYVFHSSCESMCARMRVYTHALTSLVPDRKIAASAHKTRQHGHMQLRLTSLPNLAPLFHHPLLHPARPQATQPVSPYISERERGRHKTQSVEEYMHTQRKQDKDRSTRLSLLQTHTGARTSTGFTTEEGCKDKDRKGTRGEWRISVPLQWHSHLSQPSPVPGIA